MNKSLLRLFCFLNIIVLLWAVEYGTDGFRSCKAYDLNAAITNGVRYLHGDSLKLDGEKANNLRHLRFTGIGNGTDIQQLILDTQQYLNSSNSKCVNDALFLLKNIEQKQLWALRVVDSFGKPESGLLQGNFKWIGDYNECTQARSTNPESEGNFKGKYCSLTILLPPSFDLPPYPFTIGVCVPDSCSNEELQNVLNVTNIAGVILNDTKYDVTATIMCQPTEREWNAPAIAVLFVLSLFTLLAVLGSSITVMKYVKSMLTEVNEPSLIVNVSGREKIIGVGNDLKETRLESKECLVNNDTSSDQSTGVLDKLEKFLSCFCVFTNGAKLLGTDASEGQLLCIHGIRFLSMSWVILGHTYVFPFMTAIRNQVEAITVVDSFAFQVVLQGFYSVDSFFVLSGFLLTYLAMKEFAKSKGSINWPYFYVHRYIRLTPMYMILLGFSASVYYHLGSGPFWALPQNSAEAMCEESWWWNLLYINNFRGMSEQCMGWSWYLANDMQFFVISPLFLITLWRWPKAGYSLIALFLCGTFVANFVITYHFELSPGLTSIIGDPNMVDFSQFLVKYTAFMDKIYIKPYTRIGPYLIGILLGYLLFKRKASSNPKHSLIFLSIGWIVASAVTLTCVYGLYHRYPEVLASSFYNALNRICFAAGLCWVIYVCLIGQGGVVNSILSYKLFIPLSRLTYAAYLIHPMIMTAYYASLKTTLAFSHPTMVFLFLGIMVMTYALALPVALVLESPIVSLEKIVRKAFSKKVNS